MTNKNSGIILLMAHVWQRRMNRVGKVECYKCERPLHVGERIYSRSATLRWPGSHYKWYCMECAGPEGLGFYEDVTHCILTFMEERLGDMHYFQMYVPRHNAEHVPSWVHEFTEMGVYFTLVDMDCPDGDLSHILACITCGANNQLTNKYTSGDEVWRRRKDVDFRRDAVLP